MGPLASDPPWPAESCTCTCTCTLPLLLLLEGASAMDWRALPPLVHPWEEESSPHSSAEPEEEEEKEEWPE